MGDLVLGDDGVVRCGWAEESALYRSYHDDEWGRPVVDDARLFEKIVLEGFQAGLSWITILRKREVFREVFSGFETEAVAAFGPADVDRLLSDAGIVRHRGKIEAAIGNAQAAVALAEECGGLAAYFWPWAPERPAPAGFDDIPAVDPGLDFAEQGPQAARVALRGADHGLRLHAGDGPGQRPPGRVPCGRSVQA